MTKIIKDHNSYLHKSYVHHVLILFCEGKNDNIFFSKVCEKLNIRYKPFYVEGSSKDNINKFCRLLQGEKYNYTKKSFEAIIYSDNGKDSLIKKHFKAIVRQLFSQQKNLEFIVVLDQDSNVDTNKYIDLIEVTLKNTRIEHTITKTNQDTVIILSKKNAAYSISFRVFMIDECFEAQLVKYTLEKRRISQRKISEIKKKRPHESILILCEELECKKEELIGMAVKEEWFENEDWFKKIKSEFK